MNAKRMIQGCALAALVVASFGCDRRESGTAGAEVKQRGADHPSSVNKPEQSGRAIRDRNELVDDGQEERLELVNRPVDMGHIQVTRVSNDRLFWMGGSAEHAVPVLLDEGARAGLEGKPLAALQYVKVEGTVQRLPDVQTLQTQWNLPPEEAQALSQSNPIYVLAHRVTFELAGGQPPEPGHR
ncbi:hypothetical protein [Polyangium aurulentum]|uniref:hypothetical protein n=1 Tax=Polyangium aurulentum TaxID=2567896 RepID=UPI0010AE0BFA|nr:hypothetical protein [Polyangium aurulentum]UQA58406.1 hypothetical protein E8A73_045375 [Polyangium aurulentum]